MNNQGTLIRHKVPPKMKSMTCKQYNNLGETDQEFILWARGVVLGQRVENIYMYVLFQVDGFYIEVQFHKPTATVTTFLTFEDTDLLEPYLEQIDIESVFDSPYNSR